MAAVTYSKILDMNPMGSDNNGIWLSSYTDKSEVEQKSEHWKTREEGTKGIQQEMEQKSPLLEFASIMRIFD